MIETIRERQQNKEFTQWLGLDSYAKELHIEMAKEVVNGTINAAKALELLRHLWQLYCFGYTAFYSGKYANGIEWMYSEPDVRYVFYDDEYKNDKLFDSYMKDLEFFEAIGVSIGEWLKDNTEAVRLSRQAEETGLEADSIEDQLHNQYMNRKYTVEWATWEENKKLERKNS